MGIELKRDGQRIYLTGDTFPIKNRIKDLGGHWDGERRAWWVGLAKEEEAKRLVSEKPESEDPDSIRLTGKGTYKGKSYFLGASNRDGTRIRCLTLPDANGKYLDFWVNSSLVTVTKTYKPREVRGRNEYMTLGSIARFVAKEKDNRNRDGDVCAECGRSGDLVQDLEDGMMKHYRCCDIPG